MSSPNPRSRRTFDPGWLTPLGLFGFLGFLPGLDGFRIFFLFSLIGMLASFFRKREPANAKLPEPAFDPATLPLNGPAQVGGQALMMVRVYASYLLSFLNPIQLGQSVLQALGQLMALLRAQGVVPDPTYAQKTRYTLPFRGEWFVFNGGTTPETSHSWDILAQRYAYDFVCIDAARMRHRGNGSELVDYLCYGQDLLAPADGEVIAVRDGVRDAPKPGSGWLDFLSTDFRGNHIVIKHAEREYSVLAHLLPGSIAVTKGERVLRNQVVGRCGNSGHSTEPHVHFQVQDHPNFWLALGLPVLFDCIAIGAGADDKPDARGQYLVRGMRYISNHE